MDKFIIGNYYVLKKDIRKKNNIDILTDEIVVYKYVGKSNFMPFLGKVYDEFEIRITPFAFTFNIVKLDKRTLEEL